MKITCWADPLTRAERRELAKKLAAWSLRFGEAAVAQQSVPWSHQRGKVSAFGASQECSDLRIDVTERAAVTAA